MEINGVLEPMVQAPFGSFSGQQISLIAPAPLFKPHDDHSQIILNNIASASLWNSMT